MNTFADILKTLQVEFEETIKKTSSSVVRDYKFPEAKNLIKVAVGMRRSGKTYFLYQTIRELLAKEVPLKRILFINFEDDRLEPIDHKKMGALVDMWYTLYPENHNHCCYLFLDEVQNVDKWATVLRRLLDSKNVQIYVTGSSAKLLSKEIATSLRGRAITIEIAPYSYLEFLNAHSLSTPKKPLGGKTLDIQRSYLLKYFKLGGFPGIQSLLPNEQLETLQNYVTTVIFRDVVERHHISNVSLLKYFIHSLLKNTSSLFSINKFYKDIKSRGLEVGKDTLHTYLSYIEDAFLIFTVPIFTESLRRMQTTPKKIYAIDNGLIHANTLNFSSNIGKLLENQVYLNLRRENKKIFYYKTTDGYEIDFITQDHQGKFEIIQVCWDTDDEKTVQREMRALEQAKNELGFHGKLVNAASYLEIYTNEIRTTRTEETLTQ
jgi:predicted AAA+ superfamily ATPase